MLKCPYCGHLLRLGSRRCMFCFRQVDSAEGNETGKSIFRRNWRVLLIRALLILIVVLTLLIFYRAAKLSLGLN